MKINKAKAVTLMYALDYYIDDLIKEKGHKSLINDAEKLMKEVCAEGKLPYMDRRTRIEAKSPTPCKNHSCNHCK